MLLHALPSAKFPSLLWYYDPLRLPSHSSPFHQSAYRVALYGYHRASEGLPSSSAQLSLHANPYTPESSSALLSKFFGAFHGLRQQLRGSALSLSHFWVIYNDAVGFTRKHFGLQVCSPNLGLYLRASSLGFHHQMPDSYEAAWPLPRLDFHQQVVPSFARRASCIKSLLLIIHLRLPTFHPLLFSCPSN